MDHTQIINPFEQLNYLLQYALNISPQTQSNPSVLQIPEEKKLQEMMGKVSLRDTQQQKMSYSIDQTGEKDESLLMQSPRTIKDYTKFKWMQPLDTNIQQIMQKNNSIKNKHLKSLLSIIQHREQECKFQSVEVYPHSHNLAANCDIKKGETLLEISEDWILDNSTTPRTWINIYIQVVSQAMFQGKAVFKPNPMVGERYFINHMNKIQSFNIPIYIFERKFIEKINKLPCEQDNISDNFEWLYFKLLPQSFDYHPLAERENIKLYHKNIGNQLEKLQFQFFEEYKLIKQLIDSQYIIDRYSFRFFLASYVSIGQKMFKQYQKLFTHRNYTWVKLCEQTRVFEIPAKKQSYEYNHRLDKLIPTMNKKMLIPFLDLLHHSNTFNNLSWDYNPQSSSVVVKAVKDIKKGDLLYISYQNISMESCYIQYGFVEANETGHVDLKLSMNFELIQWIVKEMFDRKLTRRFLNFLEKYSVYNEIKTEVRITSFSSVSQKILHMTKEIISKDVIDAYTELALSLIYKYEPQVQKKACPKKQMIMKMKLKNKINGVMSTSLQNQIKQKKDLIENIMHKSQRSFLNQKAIFVDKSGILSTGTIVDEDVEFSRKEEQVKNFNSLYNLTAVKTILMSELAILLQVLPLFNEKE